ncbi:flagellar hook-associated protein FlgK [Desulfogranum marinum]|uniref:flagellar hook-associated protein FlgK n=1 Tax=Desulfogranum marinum TaxID=453220 RepID=UPI001963FE9C|nr:flagellar hook-associated protein FlgK [Desulfogranum marinum]MBM9513159.1 flagellar hook-associated protein FlgK [Desulfogranum marinum]
MAGLLDALNAGKTSLSTNQKSIEIVGNNVANVNTEGYSRQRAELMQIPAVNFGDFFIGQGVTVSDVSRDYSSFISRQLQESNIAFGEETGRSNTLSELERIFNVSDDNLASEIDDFFDAWQELTTNPSGAVERDVVLQRGQLLGDAFRQVSDELNTITQNLNTEIIGEVEQLNEKISEIAKLNDRIRQIEIGGQQANAARDQRDLLVQDLSQTLGVKTYSDNLGMLAVVLPGGTPLVQGNTAMTIQTVTTGTNVELQVEIAGTIKDISREELGGEFRGIYEMRDVFVEGLHDDLDTLAIDITSSVNDIHDDGYFIDPTTDIATTGQFFFTDITALPSDVRASRSITTAFTDSRYIAAAGQDTAAPGDNENALKIAALETSHNVTGTDGNYDAFFSQMVSTVGIEASRNDLALKGAEDTTVQLQNLRDGYSGVSLEEEMIDLIQYQRGFQSSAKFLSTVDEMMNSLLQLKG